MSAQNHGRGHHGNTPAAWTLTIIVLIGSLVSGLAVVAATPWLFWVGIGVGVIGVIAGQALRMAGFGNIPARR